jgi:hypothetical protein
MPPPKKPLSDEEKKRRAEQSTVGASGRTRKQQREYMRKYRVKHIQQMTEAAGATAQAFVTKDELMQMISNRLRDGQGSMHDFRTLAELYSSMQGWAYPTLSDQAKKMLLWIRERREETEDNKGLIAKRMKVQATPDDPFDAVRELEEENE